MNQLEQSLAYRPSAEDLATVRALSPEALPRVSVVVPSFNQARYIGATLDSVMAQDYPNSEIFVADGGSTDGSVEIISGYASRYPDRIRFESMPDGGHRHGVNKAIANTTGSIIAWINSDDLYVPEAFWKVVSFFHFNRCAMVVYGRNNYVDDDLQFVAEYPVDWSPLLAEQKRRMMHFCLPAQPSLFFKRTAVGMCGDLKHKILDYELWMRWQENIPFFFLDDLLSLSRVHKEAISVKADTVLLRDICAVVHQYYGLVPYSWTLRYAHNRAYGAAWARGEAAPMTRRIRRQAWWIWFSINATRLPGALGDVGRRARSLLAESRRSGA